MPRRKQKQEDDDLFEDDRPLPVDDAEEGNEAAGDIDESDSILLLKTDNILQAQFLVGALEEEEIPFVAKRLGLPDRAGGAITHTAFDAPGPAEIYVSADDYDRAKELLDSLEGQAIGDFDEDDDDDGEEGYFEEEEDR